ncbi:hypothetical protein RJT34_12106 [Clitoria ternatea]|uniref:CRAL-TRIO domain-containing protein n=1 Tax=Clitoria ternatea TaxID=43366 RepID=A0AAN9JL57_CLITE
MLMIILFGLNEKCEFPWSVPRGAITWIQLKMKVQKREHKRKSESESASASLSLTNPFLTCTIFFLLGLVRSFIYAYIERETVVDFWCIVPHLRFYRGHQTLKRYHSDELKSWTCPSREDFRKLQSQSNVCCALPARPKLFETLLESNLHGVGFESPTSEVWESGAGVTTLTKMSRDPKKAASNGQEKMLASQEQQAKINEVRRLIGPLSGKASIYCSDASISRYLRARNWNVKKATKMLKQSLKWRQEYKPEEIRWEDVAHEAETGKIYRTNYVDKHGRTVLVMRPSRQNSKSTKGQIKYLVYCMENAILNLPPDQEQMVWLIDFQGFNMSHISIKVTRDTAHVLQEHYPERLGLAILYNAPKFFEPFFMMVKPLLEPKTYNKVKFGYSDDQNTRKLMEDLFDFDLLEAAFGGKDDTGFDISKYAERMKEDDKKIPSFWTRENTASSVPNLAHSLDSIRLDSDSDASDNEKIDSSSDHRVDTSIINPDENILVNEDERNVSADVH